MLSARKLHLATGLKVQGLDLRKAELDFYILRYLAVATVSTMICGLAYVGLIKIRVPERMQPPHRSWQLFCFYSSAALTMAIALFNLVITGFLVVNAQGLMLRGPSDSVARCIQILRQHWTMVKVGLGSCLLSLCFAGLSMVWMKLDGTPGYPWPAVASSVVVGTAVAAASARIWRISREMAIDHSALVEGDLSIMRDQGASVDILSEQSEVIPVSRG